jgi:8-oxo-dGTP pyrophosphatase MutT (NUDIX family)
MNYIQEIRSLVGHRPLILVGAIILIFDERNKILLQHRNDDHYWDFPGGFMELGETVEETARREILEETGLMVHSLSLVDIFSGKDYFYTYPNGDQVNAVVVVFESHSFSGCAKADGVEGSEVQFFPVNHLPEPMLGSSRMILEKHLGRPIGQ